MGERLLWRGCSGEAALERLLWRGCSGEEALEKLFESAFGPCTLIVDHIIHLIVEVVESSPS